GAAAHSTSAGATTRSPTASPSHQVHQIAPYSAQRANPVKASVVTPTVAPTVVLTMPASTVKANTSCGRSNARRPRAKRLTRYAPRSEEHTSELQSLAYLVCRLLLEKKNPSQT